MTQVVIDKLTALETPDLLLLAAFYSIPSDKDLLENVAREILNEQRGQMNDDDLDELSEELDALSLDEDEIVDTPFSESESTTEEEYIDDQEERDLNELEMDYPSSESSDVSGELDFEGNKITAVLSESESDSSDFIPKVAQKSVSVTKRRRLH